MFLDPLNPILEFKSIFLVQRHQKCTREVKKHTSRYLIPRTLILPLALLELFLEFGAKITLEII